MCKSASLLLELVLTLKAGQPEPTQFRLNLAFPWVFCLCIFFRWWTNIYVDFYGRLLVVFNGWLFNEILFAWWALVNAIKANIFLVWVAVASLRWSVGASCLRRSLVKVRLCLSDRQVEHWNRIKFLILSHHLRWGRTWNEFWLLILEAHLFTKSLMTRVTIERRLFRILAIEVYSILILALHLVLCYERVMHLLVLEIGVSICLLISKLHVVVWSSWWWCLTTDDARLFTQVTNGNAIAAVHKLWWVHIDLEWLGVSQ